MLLKINVTGLTTHRTLLQLQLHSSFLEVLQQSLCEATHGEGCPRTLGRGEVLERGEALGCPRTLSRGEVLGCPWILGQGDVLRGGKGSGAWGGSGLWGGLGP